MSADTLTALLGLLLQGTGNNNNAWGQNLNDQVIQLIEDAVAGRVSIATTGGTLTLTAAQARMATIVLTGNLASDLTVVLPDTSKVYRFINSTVGGGFFTLFKCVTAATTGNLPSGGAMTTIIVVDGVPFRQNISEVGRLVYDANLLKDDVLECNGAAYKRASLPNLFSRIGTTYGNNDGTDFKVPDAYTTGRFLRSRTAAVAVGTTQSNQNKSHTHTGSGTTSGVSVGHTHTGSGTTTGVSAFHTHTGSGTTTVESADHSHTFSGTTATESATHTHTTGGLGTVAVNNGTGSSQGNLLTTSGGTPATIGPSSTESATHTHTYSGTTSGISVTHTHTYSFTTSTDSVDHTHTYSFTTSGVSADHTHTYSFTTSTGSADGTEARPESLVGILCIRY